MKWKIELCKYKTVFVEAEDFKSAVDKAMKENPEYPGFTGAEAVKEMVKVKKMNGGVLITVKKNEIEPFIEFLLGCPCRHPEHTHEKILQRLLKITKVGDRTTTEQREKLMLMGVQPCGE